MVSTTYTRWRCKPIFQRPATGSTWWRGNFSLGLHVDVHQRWVNVILCLLVVEIGLGWSREAIVPRPYDTVAGLPIRAE